jgi:hypothetical protein
MWSIVGSIGLFVSFSRATLLAATAVKNKDEILNEAAPRLPVSAGPPVTDKFKEALLRLPQVQALLRQSRVAKYGLWILTISFLLQFSGALALFIYP